MSELLELSSFVGKSCDVDKKIAQAAMSSRWIAILCGEVVFSFVAMLNSVGTRPKAARAEPREKEVLRSARTKQRRAGDIRRARRDTTLPLPIYDIGARARQPDLAVGCPCPV